MADWESAAFREAVRLAIAPMLASFALLDHGGMDAGGLAWYAAGVALLNLGMYAGGPALLVVGLVKMSKTRQ